MLRAAALHKKINEIGDLIFGLRYIVLYKLYQDSLTFFYENGVETVPV